MSTLEQWESVEAPKEISTAELDKVIIEMRELRKDYEEKKKLSNEAHAVYKESEDRVLGLLKATKKSKYSVDGYGTAYTITKYVVATPKTSDSKKQLFDYIKVKHGPDALMGMVSINHQTLNSFYNSEAKEYAAKGEMFVLPGIGEPTTEESVGFRSDGQSKVAE
jgi:hypothetical protein